MSPRLYGFTQCKKDHWDKIVIEVWRPHRSGSLEIKRIKILFSISPLISGILFVLPLISGILFALQLTEVLMPPEK